MPIPAPSTLKYRRRSERRSAAGSGTAGRCRACAALPAARCQRCDCVAGTPGAARQGTDPDDRARRVLSGAAPMAERWALVLRLTPGPWQRATGRHTRWLRHDGPARADAPRIRPLPPRAPSCRARHPPARPAAKNRRCSRLFLLPSCRQRGMRLDELLLAVLRRRTLPVVLLERNLRGHNRPLDTDLVAGRRTATPLGAPATCSTSAASGSPIVVASPTSSHNDRVAGYLYALHAAQIANRKSCRTQAARAAPERTCRPARPTRASPTRSASTTSMGSCVTRTTRPSG